MDSLKGSLSVREISALSSIVQIGAATYIADFISIPKILGGEASLDSETFERKKAGLKQKFLAHGLEEALSNG